MSPIINHKPLLFSGNIKLCADIIYASGDYENIKKRAKNRCSRNS